MPKAVGEIAPATGSPTLSPRFATTAATIRNWEIGAVSPQIDFLARATKALNIQVGDVVVTWTGAPCPPSDNQDVAWVDITIDHTVPIFFPWVPGNGDLSSSTEFRMEPEP